MKKTIIIIAFVFTLQITFALPATIDLYAMEYVKAQPPSSEYQRSEIRLEKASSFATLGDDGSGTTDGSLRGITPPDPNGPGYGEIPVSSSYAILYLGIFYGLSVFLRRKKPMFYKTVNA